MAGTGKGCAELMLGSRDDWMIMVHATHYTSYVMYFSTTIDRDIRRPSCDSPELVAVGSTSLGDRLIWVGSLAPITVAPGRSSPRGWGTGLHVPAVVAHPVQLLTRIAMRCDLALTPLLRGAPSCCAAICIAEVPSSPATVDTRSIHIIDALGGSEYSHRHHGAGGRKCMDCHLACDD